MSICHPPRDNDVMPLLIGQIILEGKTISWRNFDHRLKLLKIALFWKIDSLKCTQIIFCQLTYNALGSRSVSNPGSSVHLQFYCNLELPSQAHLSYIKTRFV